MAETAGYDPVLKCLYVSEVMCKDWQCLGVNLGLATDTDIANFLIQQ